MATHFDDAHNIVIPTDDARGGETGHHVRYILVFGMTGVILAFAGIAVYSGFDDLQARIAAALAQNPYDVLRGLAPYAAVLFAGAVGIGLLLGLWSLIAGRSPNASQSFMRFRIVAQFAVICVIMAMLLLPA